MFLRLTSHKYIDKYMEMKNLFESMQKLKQGVKRQFL